MSMATEAREIKLSGLPKQWLGWPLNRWAQLELFRGQIKCSAEIPLPNPFAWPLPGRTGAFHIQGSSTA